MDWRRCLSAPWRYQGLAWGGEGSCFLLALLISLGGQGSDYNPVPALGLGDRGREGAVQALAALLLSA